jgi:hypothetical protein
LRLKEMTEQETQAILAQLRLDQKDARIGAIISSDDIPVHPQSLEGYNYFFLFRDTKSRKIFVFPSRTNDSKAYLRVLGKVLSFFKRIYADRPDLGQRPPTIVRTDRFKVFDSGECQLFYDDNDCFHQEASAYRHHQVAAERDV